jgi:hypothetical protein
MASLAGRLVSASSHIFTDSASLAPFSLKVYWIARVFRPPIVSVAAVLKSDSSKMSGSPLRRMFRVQRKKPHRGSVLRKYAPAALADSLVVSR